MSFLSRRSGFRGGPILVDTRMIVGRPTAAIREPGCLTRLSPVLQMIRARRLALGAMTSA